MPFWLTLLLNKTYICVACYLIIWIHSETFIEVPIDVKSLSVVLDPTVDERAWGPAVYVCVRMFKRHLQEAAYVEYIE
jgi:hypothetical protein